jgi:hypothetical protein
MDSLLQHPLQPLPLDIVKEPLDVRFHHKIVPAKLQLPVQVLERIVRANTWSISVAAWCPCGKDA